mmetsp:Transcript_45485/g.90068  ORF Transcript_45485/g.90068 Transcript_45485/m.90068 type:complete len:272 (-) Transcript_45485:932-1747(-)
MTDSRGRGCSRSATNEQIMLGLGKIAKESHDFSTQLGVEKHEETLENLRRSPMRLPRNGGLPGVRQPIAPLPAALKIELPQSTLMTAHGIDVVGVFNAAANVHRGKEERHGDIVVHPIARLWVKHHGPPILQQVPSPVSEIREVVVTVSRRWIAERVYLHGVRHRHNAWIRIVVQIIEIQFVAFVARPWVRKSVGFLVGRTMVFYQQPTSRPKHCFYSIEHADQIVRRMTPCELSGAQLCAQMVKSAAKQPINPTLNNRQVMMPLACRLGK